VLSFLAGHRLHVTLLVVLPVVLFNMQFLRGPMSPPTREFKFLLYGALRAFDEAKGPLIFALIGWGIDRLPAASRGGHPCKDHPRRRQGAMSFLPWTLGVQS
jgi:hypothetical protein